MAIGLKVPIGVNSSGGMARVSGDENNTKIIKLGLSDTDNENAFQQNLGIGTEMIFELNDERVTGLLEDKIDELFESFEVQKRFKLLDDTIEWSTNEAKQELFLKFRYMDLESDEEKTFSRNFRSGD